MHFDWFLPIVHQSEDVRIDDVTIINDALRATFFWGPHFDVICDGSSQNRHKANVDSIWSKNKI